MKIPPIDKEDRFNPAVLTDEQLKDYLKFHKKRFNQLLNELIDRLVK